MTQVDPMLLRPLFENRSLPTNGRRQAWIEGDLSKAGEASDLSNIQNLGKLAMNRGCSMILLIVFWDANHGFSMFFSWGFRWSVDRIIQDLLVCRYDRLLQRTRDPHLCLEELGLELAHLFFWPFLSHSKGVPPPNSSPGSHKDPHPTSGLPGGRDRARVLAADLAGPPTSGFAGRGPGLEAATKAKG